MDTQLEEMRQQMETLRKKLEKQEIVNTSLIRKSVRKNVSSINARNLAVCILALMMIPYCYWVFILQLHFSIAFWAFTALFNVACVVYTYYNTKDLLNNRLMQEELVEARRKVARAKKLDSQWLLVGIPFIFVWLAWFAYEVYKMNGMDGLTGFGLAATVGGTIGGILGFRIHYKTQRNYQDIIDQIEDLTTES